MPAASKKLCADHVEHGRCKCYGWKKSKLFHGKVADFEPTHWKELATASLPKLESFGNLPLALCELLTFATKVRSGEFDLQVSLIAATNRKVCFPDFARFQGCMYGTRCPIGHYKPEDLTSEQWDTIATKMLDHKDCPFLDLPPHLQSILRDAVAFCAHEAEALPAIEVDNSNQGGRHDKWVSDMLCALEAQCRAECQSAEVAEADRIQHMRRVEEVSAKLHMQLTIEKENSHLLQQQIEDQKRGIALHKAEWDRERDAKAAVIIQLREQVAARDLDIERLSNAFQHSQVELHELRASQSDASEARFRELLATMSTLKSQLSQACSKDGFVSPTLA